MTGGNPILGNLHIVDPDIHFWQDQIEARILGDPPVESSAIWRLAVLRPLRALPKLFAQSSAAHWTTAGCWDVASAL